MDVLLIDRLDDRQITDNDIARLFVKHNIVELKNPGETLDEDTIWKVISYAAQYKSQKKENKYHWKLKKNVGQRKFTISCSPYILAAFCISSSFSPEFTTR